MTSTTNGTPWVVCPRPNPRARLRLFCFPYAGGGATAFRSWQELLTRDAELCAVQLPGRETRIKEAPVARLSSLLRVLAPAMLPHLDRPFAFFGHSLGTLVSFELARRLRREYAVEPLQLFLSGRGAPQIPDDRRAIHALPEPEFREELRAMGGTPEGVLEHPELLRLIVPVLRADFAVCETYEYAPEPPLDCPISAFGGTEDFEVPAAHLEAWREQTNGPFRLRMFPGDHFYIHTARAALLAALNQELELLARRAA